MAAGQTQGGNLDRRITILRPVLVPNDYNEQVEEFSPLIDIWAGKADLSGFEALKNAEVKADITTRFTVRYSTVTATITPKDRISYDGKTYSIFAVREKVDRRLAYLEIDAAARADR